MEAAFGSLNKWNLLLRAKRTDRLPTRCLWSQRDYLLFARRALDDRYDVKAAVRIDSPGLVPERCHFDECTKMLRGSPKPGIEVCTSGSIDIAGAKLDQPLRRLFR